MFTSPWGYALFFLAVLCLALVFLTSYPYWAIPSLIFGCAATPFERDYPSGF